MVSEPSPALEQRLLAAVESVPTGILMVDAEGTIVLVNREIEILFGYRREELIGGPIEILVPDHQQEAHTMDRASFVENPQSRRMGTGRDLFAQRKDGTRIPVEIGLTPVVTEEGTFVVSAVVDISERKRAEQENRALGEQLRQAQKMEAVGTLAGGIAHDFNNILAAIIGYAELIQAAVAHLPEAAEDVADLLESSEKGKQLVERILSFSRRQPQRRRPITLASPLDDAVKLLRSSLSPSIAIHTKVDGETPRVLADPTSVHQVLMNLGTNGAHAITGQGTLELSIEPFYARDSFVRSHPELREGSYGVLVVRDTGSGMDRAVLERAFEPFFTTKAAGSGTGLGLSVVHRIMHDHEGAIYFDSTPGQGTIARCYFPAAPDGTAERAAAVSAAPRGNGERILYVDDDKGLLEVGRRRLVALGYSVIAESDIEGALHIARTARCPFDLVITDYWMPAMKGTELARTIHGTDSALPIVMLTGMNEELPAEALVGTGIVRVVQKPVTARQLADMVAETVRRVPRFSAAPLDEGAGSVGKPASSTSAVEERH